MKRLVGRIEQHWHLGVVLACIVGGAFVLGATTRGIGLTPDSVQYLAAARSASDGHGLITYAWDGAPVPLSHFPPGYPLVLSIAGQVGWSPLVFARWLNVALFVLNIIVASLITLRVARTDRAQVSVPAVAGLYAVGHDAVVTHSMAWSEPLYILLTLAGVLALSIGIERRLLILLLVGAVLAGLAAIVRYAGVANVAVVSLAVLLWWPATFWRRFGLAASTGAIAAVPLFIVLALSASATDLPVANRQFVWHPIGVADLWMAAAVIGKWVTPLSDASYLTAAWLGAILALLSVVIVMRRGRTNDEGEYGSLIAKRVLLLYAVMYMVVLVLTMSVFDAQTLFDARLLVPLLAVAVILGVTWLAKRASDTPRIRIAAFAILALVGVAELSRLAPWARAVYRGGIALRRLDGDDSTLVQATNRLPAVARIYSNRPYFLRVQTSRMVAGVPRQVDPNSLLPNPRFDEQVRAICDNATKQETYVVLFEQDESEDPTANAPAPARAGDVTPLPGGLVVRVFPGCGSHA